MGNARDLLTYAVGIGCQDLQFTYENDGDFQAFPTYPIALGFKGIDQDVISFPSPAMMEGPEMPQLPGIKAGLDGERYIEKINDLDPDGSQLILRSRLAGVQQKGKGASVHMESFLEDETGKQYYRMTGATFLVGAKDFTGAGESFSEVVKLPERAPDKVEELFVPENQAQIYRLSGDYNPLHIDPDAATMMGFEVPILHGLCSLGFTARAFRIAGATWPDAGGRDVGGVWWEGPPADQGQRDRQGGHQQRIWCSHSACRHRSQVVDKVRWFACVAK